MQKVSHQLNRALEAGTQTCGEKCANADPGTGRRQRRAGELLREIGAIAERQPAAMFNRFPKEKFTPFAAVTGDERDYDRRHQSTFRKCSLLRLAFVANTSSNTACDANNRHTKQHCRTNTYSDADDADGRYHCAPDRADHDTTDHSGADTHPACPADHHHGRASTDHHPADKAECNGHCWAYHYCAN